MVGNGHAGLLQNLCVVFVGDAGILLGLLAFQIGFGQLVDGFIQKGRATHGRLANREVQDFIGGFVFEQFLEGVFHQGFGKHLRGVIGSGLLPVATRQAVDKGAFGVEAQFLMAVFILVIHTLVFRISLQIVRADKIAGFQLVGAGAGFFDFVQILVGKETPVGQQGFIHRT